MVTVTAIFSWLFYRNFPNHTTRIVVLFKTSEMKTLSFFISVFKNYRYCSIARDFSTSIHLPWLCVINKLMVCQGIGSQWLSWPPTMKRTSWTTNGQLFKSGTVISKWDDELLRFHKIKYWYISTVYCIDGSIKLSSKQFCESLNSVSCSQAETLF